MRTCRPAWSSSEVLRRRFVEHRTWESATPPLKDPDRLPDSSTLRRRRDENAGPDESRLRHQRHPWPMIESRKHKGHQRMICFAQAAQSKPRLQSSGESGIKTIVLLGGSLAGAESSTDSAQKRAEQTSARRESRLD